MAPGTGRAHHMAAISGGQQPNAAKAAQPQWAKWSRQELTTNLHIFAQHVRNTSNLKQTQDQVQVERKHKEFGRGAD